MTRNQYKTLDRRARCTSLIINTQHGADHLAIYRTADGTCVTERLGAEPPGAEIASRLLWAADYRRSNRRLYAHNELTALPVYRRANPIRLPA